MKIETNPAKSRQNYLKDVKNDPAILLVAQRIYDTEFLFCRIDIKFENSCTANWTVDHSIARSYRIVHK